MPARLLTGDCIEMLRQLPDGCVQTVITSPPYFGLRDYQTAKWEGGDPQCQHTISHYSDPKHAGNVDRPSRGDRSACIKCGAQRVDLQLGLEPTPDLYIKNLVGIFREIKRVLRKDGTAWLNLGDSYNGSGGAGGDYNAGGIKAGQPKFPGRSVNGFKPKDLMLIPARVAIALQEDGWYVRSEIIWAKKNPMPESVRDRPTKSHEVIFLLAKSRRYFYDAEAIKEPAVTNDLRRPYTSQGAWELDGRPPEQRHGGELRSRRDSFKRENSKRAQVIPGQRVGTHRPDREENDYDTATRNKRSVWHVSVKPFKGAHFATFPPDLIEPCVLAGTSAYGCCEKCGAPWERVIETKKVMAGGSGKAGRSAEDANANGKWQGNQNGRDIKLGPVTMTTTLHWRPTCKCEAGIVPCLVLDPFVGSGTTGMVALHHGRNFVGIDVNADYVAMAEKRIAKGYNLGKQKTTATKLIKIKPPLRVRKFTQMELINEQL